MSDETTPPTGPDEGAPPPAPGERSWAPETGWPAATPPPSWAEVEDPTSSSDEEELDAWLDAQDTEPETLPAAEPAPEPESADRPAEPAEPLAVAELPAEPDADPQPVPADEPGHAVEASTTIETPTTVDAPAVEAAAQAPEPAEEPVTDVPEPADAPVDEPVTDVREPADEAAAAVAEPADDAVEPVDDAVEPVDDATEPVVEHGADQDAAELASAALFSPVPAEVVTPAEAEPGTTVPAPADEQPAVPGERSATVVVALLVALVLVLAGLTAFLAERSVSTRGGGGVEDARHDGLQAARNAARLVFSYDYRHLDKDFAAGKAQTTGAFAQQYGTTTPKLVEVAKTYKAVVAADVSDAAVISASSGKVVVLVFVNQQSTSTLAAAPKITQSRVTMTMLHRHGRWLVSDVHAF